MSILKERYNSIEFSKFFDTYIIDKSEELSKLQRELGRLAEIQDEYNKEIFEKLEKKSNTAEAVNNVIDISEDDNSYEGDMWDDE